MKLSLYLIVIITLLFSTDSYSAESKSPERLSPFAKMLINDMNESGSAKALAFGEEGGKYIIFELDDDLWTGAIVRVDEGLAKEDLESKGIIVGSLIGDIWSIKFRLDDLEKVLNIKDILYFQVDEPVGLHMNKSRLLTNINPLHETGGLFTPVTGEGVILGVIDVGFDLTSPAFFDDSRNDYRIKSLWIQWNGRKSGPPGFDYGVEYEKRDIMLAYGSDYQSLSHGTHVASIAAGSSFMNGGKYRGPAKSAELIFVSPLIKDEESILTGQSFILDGITYIFRKADEEKKTAVVNMSLGTHIGPHDGTALFDIACDRLTGPGRIIVTSGGNDGEVPMHIMHDFFHDGSSFSTIPVFEKNSGKAQGFVDIWGETAEEICITGGIYYNGDIRWLQQSYCTSSDDDIRDILITQDGRNCTFEFFMSSSDFNGKPRIFVDGDNRSNGDIVLKIEGSGTVHLWNSLTGGSSGGIFKNNGLPGVKSGDNQYSISEIGGNSQSIITVGAFTGRNTFTNVSGQNINISHFTQEGEISSFSSKGPAVGGLVKPDITAPGNIVFASINSFDENFDRFGELYSYVIERADYGNFAFGGLSGTSMSSPLVAGVIAQMLEVFPVLDPAKARELIAASATRDNFTGNISIPGSTTWGMGKLNAYDAVNIAYNYYESIKNESDIIVYPNPSPDGIFKVDYLGAYIGNYKIKAYDVLGKLVWAGEHRSSTTKSSTELNLQSYSTGMYRLVMESPFHNESVTIVITR